MKHLDDTSHQLQIQQIVFKKKVRYFEETSEKHFRLDSSSLVVLRVGTVNFKNKIDTSNRHNMIS